MKRTSQPSMRAPLKLWIVTSPTKPVFQTLGYLNSALHVALGGGGVAVGVAVGTGVGVAPGGGVDDGVGVGVPPGGTVEKPLRI